MSTLHNTSLTKPTVNKKLATKKQSPRAPICYGISVFNPKSKLPFRYSNLVCALSACMLAQVALPSLAYAASSSTLPDRVSNNLSQDELDQIDEVLLNSAADTNNSEDRSRIKQNQQLSDAQLEEALIGLRLKRAVEQGQLDASVLEDYQRETLNNNDGDSDSVEITNAQKDRFTNYSSSTSDRIGNSAPNNNLANVSDVQIEKSGLDDITINDASSNNSNISRATVDSLGKYDDTDARQTSNGQGSNNPDYTGNANNGQSALNIDDFTSEQTLQTPEELDRMLDQIQAQVNTDFDRPVATLDDSQPPLGFDTRLDQTTVLNPRNRVTLGLLDNEDDNISAEMTDNRSDNNDSNSSSDNNPTIANNRTGSSGNSKAVTENSARPTFNTNTGGVDTSPRSDNTIISTNNTSVSENNSQSNNSSIRNRDEDTQVQIEASDHKSKDVSLTEETPNEPSSDPVTAANIGKIDNSITQADGDITDDLVTQAQEDSNTDSGINPDEYLPEYDSEANGGYNRDAVLANVEEEKEEEEVAKPSLFKRIYARLFNDGYTALPRLKANIYIQADENDDSSQPTLVKADDDTQPANNIKAAMENITVEAISDFTAVIPKLREESLNAAQAVGYYDINMRFEKKDADEINVIIEHLGEPVIVNSRIVDIRGEGAELETFQEIAESAPPKTNDIFNHGVYQLAKDRVESARNLYGFFDGQWLNKSVDVILPDNTADVGLIYDTGERYKFDDVVFFTIDEEKGELTTDPDKLPVKLELLHQLHKYKPGDEFDASLVTQFTNDLAATRYFNAVNVETVKPNDSISSGSLDFMGRDSGANAESQESDESVADVVEDVINDADDNPQRAQDNSSAQSQENASAQNQNNAAAQNDVTAQSNKDDTKNESEALANNNSENNVDDDLSAEFEPIEYTVDQETTDKLAEISAKAERLSRLPDDRVLDADEEEEAKNILGRISNAISRAVRKVLPDEEDRLADTDNLPEDLSQTVLEGRKTPQQVHETKSVPTYVFVTADKPKDVDLGIGYGTDTGIRTVTRFEHNLINRDGYQAGIDVGLSEINRSVNIHASRPWKHPLNDILTANASYEQEEITQGDGNLDLKTNTVKVGVARRIRRDTGWNRTYSLRYRLDDLESGVKGPAREDLPEPFNRENARFKQEALLLGYTLDKTTTDNMTNPMKGWRQYYSLEAGTEDALTDTDMVIARAGVSGVYSFGEMNKHQLVGSLDTGYIWTDDFESVPYKLRFFAGGDRSIRGYDYNSLSAIENGYLTGGQILAIGSTEYNYEFKPGLRGAVFADFGNAYDKDFDAETKLGVGVGVRWASPVGMVRVDLGAGVLEDSIPIRLHFFIGSPLQ